MILVGVDAGSTKTKALAYDCDGNYLGEGLSGPGNPHDVGFTQAKRNVVEAINKATKGSFPDYVAIGFAGMDTAEDEITFREYFKDVGKHVITVHDSVIALFSETFGEEGIVVISGTGSVVVAYDGKSFRRVGGRGWLLSDEGSAYWVAVNVLRWMQRVFDGLAEGDRLFDFLRERLRINTHDDLVKWAYENQCRKDKIASITAIVGEAADLGVVRAKEFLIEGAELLASRVAFLVERTGIKTVVLKGSMFRSKVYLDKFRETLARVGANAFPGENPPEVGGLYLAARASGCNKVVDKLKGRSLAGKGQP